MGSIGEGKIESLKNLCKDIIEYLGPPGMETLHSLTENFKNNRIEHTEFSNSIQLLFDIDAKTQHHNVDTELEDGEIREYHVFSVSPKVDDSLKECPIQHGNLKIRADVEVRAKVDENPSGSNLHSDEQIGRIMMKKRRRYTMRLNRETPNYKLVPEEEQCPVKYEVLNNKASLVKYDAFVHKELTEYEDEMARCGDGMIEADVLMESLRSAVEKAEKVIKGEMKVGDLGAMFYTCIKNLCHVDVFERVRQDYKKALPNILPRLKHKLNNLTVARAEQESRLKQVMEDNTSKQKDSTAQGQGQGEKTHFCIRLHVSTAQGPKIKQQFLILSFVSDI